MAEIIESDNVGDDVEEASVEALMVIFGIDREAAEGMKRRAPRGCCIDVTPTEAEETKS